MKKNQEPEKQKCDVCHNGKISCADYGRIVLKVCVFCGGKG